MGGFLPEHNIPSSGVSRWSSFRLQNVQHEKWHEKFNDKQLDWIRWFGAFVYIHLLSNTRKKSLAHLWDSNRKLFLWCNLAPIVVAVNLLDYLFMSSAQNRWNSSMVSFTWPLAATVKAWIKHLSHPQLLFLHNNGKTSTEIFLRNVVEFAYSPCRLSSCNYSWRYSSPSCWSTNSSCSRDSVKTNVQKEWPTKYKRQNVFGVRFIFIFEWINVVSKERNVFSFWEDMMIKNLVHDIVLFHGFIHFLNLKRRSKL